MILTEDKINEISEIIEDKELFEDKEIEYLKSLRKKSVLDSISFASLFVICTNNLKILSSYDKVLKNEIDKFDYSKLNIFLEEYGDGTEFGAYYLGEKIKSIVNEDKIKMEEFIEAFFLIIENE
jgi:hypothetical protein